MFAECYPVQAPCDGFVVTPSGDQLGDKAHYSCEFGYVLHGDEVRECLADGHWSSHMPCCEIGKSMIKTNLLGDFFSLLQLRTAKAYTSLRICAVKQSACKNKLRK